MLFRWSWSYTTLKHIHKVTVRLYFCLEVLGLSTLKQASTLPLNPKLGLKVGNHVTLVVFRGFFIAPSPCSFLPLYSACFI